MTTVITTRSNHLPGLDGLRGLAVGAVVIFHSWEGLLPGGFIGVDLFFVLSGFLITRLLLVEHEGGGVWLVGFYARRALRLLPALAVTLALVVPVALITRDTATLAGARWNYLANVRRSTGEDLGALGHLWSLAIEEQFYVLWPVVLAVVLARGGRPAALRAAVALAVASVLWRHLLAAAADPARVYNGLDTRAGALLIGAVVALAPAVTPGLRTRGSALALLVGMAASAAWRDPVVLGVGLTLAAVASAVVITAATGPWTRPLSWAPLAQLGRVSYGVYLYHLPVGADLAPDDGPARLVVVGLVSWALATLSYELIERRFLAFQPRHGPSLGPHGSTQARDARRSIGRTRQSRSAASGPTSRRDAILMNQAKPSPGSFPTSSVRSGPMG